MLALYLIGIRGKSLVVSNGLNLGLSDDFVQCSITLTSLFFLDCRRINIYITGCNRRAERFLDCWIAGRQEQEAWNLKCSLREEQEQEAT